MVGARVREARVATRRDCIFGVVICEDVCVRVEELFFLLEGAQRCGGRGAVGMAVDGAEERCVMARAWRGSGRLDEA